MQKGIISGFLLGMGILLLLQFFLAFFLPPSGFEFLKGLLGLFFFLLGLYYY